MPIVKKVTVVDVGPLRTVELMLSVKAQAAFLLQLRMLDALAVSLSEGVANTRAAQRDIATDIMEIHHTMEKLLAVDAIL